MTDMVLYQPRRGHRCAHLRKWVTSDDTPYAVPVDTADRYVRHNLGSIVGGVDPASGPDVSTTFEITPDEEAALRVRATDPATWTKAELVAALGLGPSAERQTKRELLAMYQEVVS